MTKSELCAKQDNIKIEKGRGRGGIEVNVYCIPCDKCGEIIKLMTYGSDKTYLCEYCRKQIVRKKKILEQNELDKVLTRKEQQFAKAIGKIKAQVKNFSIYNNAINLARRRVESYGSIPEAMVAIELVKLGYQVIPQQKIGKYRVDFVLKDKKVVVEVDGSIYHRDIFKGDREAIIQLSLGMDWVIVHIPAEGIEKNIQKVKKIIDVNCNTRGKNK